MQHPHPSESLGQWPVGTLCATGQALGTARRHASYRTTGFKHLKAGPAVWGGQDREGYEAAVRRR
jgi:hypothetical protein